MRNTFKVYERLKKEQQINTLFHVGKAFSVFPIRFIYTIIPRTEDELSPIRIGFSVPKKKFRSSVLRHRIRRLMVEAWRLNKSNIYLSIPKEKQLQIFLIFTNSSLPDFETVQLAVIKGIEILLKTDVITKTIAE